MQDSFIDSVMQYTLGLGPKRQDSEVVVGTEDQRIDVFLSHCA